MSDRVHPLAAQHLPAFITPPGETDVLMVATALFVVLVILALGTLYLRLHALPERIAHRTNKVQFEIVAVLALLALFTHNGLFWVAALLLALVRIPDFAKPLALIAESQAKIARQVSDPTDRQGGAAAASAPAPRSARNEGPADV